ncbi:sigma-70 family RNA polymerase sigma factor [Catelliglobosispora koreensis]|uniref:sigma-70 family RNA polymerase sigma factor n=1 Tax=Catelliglobosispora koreensis TaxID=129052 RepID=UPI0003662A1A|nr:sigma-70 family RNA polymerase sigma factor [Catelliglobosispora koreensis]
MGPISSIAPKRRRATSLPDSGGTPRNAKAVRLLAAADQKQARQRDDLIASHMPMATHIARSFAGRGEDVEDLTQVALLELVRVASRFDPSHGATFARYAYPCIVGAVKKHFRDNGWSLHVTRRMQELHLQTSRAIPALTQQLGHTPTVADLATHLHLSEKDTRDGLRSRLAYRTRSLDQPPNDDSESELSQLLGGVDRRLEAVPDLQVLAQHMAGLPARERLMLRLRFIDDLTQREIADRLGISQMHVSRLLGRSLENLRTMFLARS